MPRSSPAVLPCALVLVLAGSSLALSGCSSSPPPPSPNEPATFTVDVGWEDPVKGVEAEAFFPASLSVNVGDTIVFTEKTHEPHTVTFNAPTPLLEVLLSQADGRAAANPAIILPAPVNPAPVNPVSGPLDLTAAVNRSASLDSDAFVSSGLLTRPGDTFTVHAAVPGTWQVLCLLHPAAMKGTLIVNPKGTPRPMADADYHVTAEYRVKDLQSRAADLLAGIRPPDAAATPDGHKLWTVYAGAGSAEDGIDVMRFIGGEKLSIKAGDSVAFDMSKGSRGTFHTVTFLSGAPAPDVLLPGGQSGYPVNPKVLLPTPSAPYDGSLYASSGLMVSGGSTPQRWTVTFTRPGSWAYQCLLHAGEGMKGTIVVQ